MSGDALSSLDAGLRADANATSGGRCACVALRGAVVLLLVGEVAVTDEVVCVSSAGGRAGMPPRAAARCFVSSLAVAGALCLSLAGRKASLVW